MDQQEQGPDQRVKLTRSKEDWEQLACKVLLLDPDGAIALRDFYYWRKTTEWANWAQSVMDALEISDTCTRSTFCTAVQRALRNMARDARRYKLKGWKTP